MTTRISSIRSLHAFTHGVNGRSWRNRASLRGLSDPSGRRLHNPIPPSTSTLGFAVDGARRARLVGANRAKKGELWK